MHQASLYIVLVGLPGSGKTTFRNTVCARLNPDELIVLSLDDEIERYAKQEGTTYTEVFSSYIETAKGIVQTARKKALLGNKNIIHDATHLTLASRSRSIFDVPDYYRKIAMVCRVDEEERQLRLLNRPGKIIPVEADDRMRTTFVNPTVEEGFDGVYPSTQWIRNM